MQRKFIFSEGEYYHIYTRGVDKRLLFLDPQDQLRFMALLFSANSLESVQLGDYARYNMDKIRKFDIPRGDPIIAIGAWCLMPNHFHLLVKEITPGGISKFMGKLLTAYSSYFNKKHGRTGVLVERPFRAKHLDTENYLKHQYAYIHLNPIAITDTGWKEKRINDKKAAKAFLEEYPYSSYFEYAYDSLRPERKIIDPNHFPRYFANLTDFHLMVDMWIDIDPE